MQSNIYQATVGAVARTPVDTFEFEPIKGYPMLNWRGKRPFTSTHFYPAQLKEQHGQTVDGWWNKILWGDNLQVMSHLLKQFRGKVDFVYIDPPFDSKADYKKTIVMRGKAVETDSTVFEEKQYTDIWSNDEYLQFIYERLVLLNELLSECGVIAIHSDYRKSHHIRCLMDEVFGPDNFLNEVIWKRRTGILNQSRKLGSATDTILLYTKSGSGYTFNPQFVPYELDDPYIKSKFVYKDLVGRVYRLHAITSPSYSPSLIYEYKGYLPPANGWAFSRETMERWEADEKLYFPADKSQRIQRKQYLDEMSGKPIQNLWDDIRPINSQANDDTRYPTQKPEELLRRLILFFTNAGDLVLDCFMGSGTTQSVAMKLGRRFLGADINLGAVQTTTRRLISVASELAALSLQGKNRDNKLPSSLHLGMNQTETIDTETGPSDLSHGLPVCYYSGFEVYNVNNYEIFRNPIEASDLIIDAMELEKLPPGHLFDGQRDGRLWKVMPVNKIATRQDLNEIINGMDLRTLAARLQDNPSQPAEKITLVCMGHEPDLAAELNRQMANNLGVNAGSKSPLDVQALDILRDRSDLQFKRDSEAKISVGRGWLKVDSFYPMNLLGKLSLEAENVTDWREMVDSIMIDWNYDGAIFTPTLVDVPEKNGLVEGKYAVPDDAGTIRVKITDVLSESLEVSVWA